MTLEELLRDNKRLNRSHVKYLVRMVKSNFVTEDVAHIALRIWMWAYDFSEKKLAVPSACVNSKNGSLMYCWDTEQHHLEIDISKDSIELFFLDLKTQTKWSDASTGDVGRMFTPTLLEHLPLFYVDKGTNRRRAVGKDKPCD